MKFSEMTAALADPAAQSETTAAAIAQMESFFMNSPKVKVAFANREIAAAD